MVVTAKVVLVQISEDEEEWIITVFIFGAGD